MRGAVFLGNRKIEIRNFPDPTPGPGEVVIEMKASGMCGSDLKFYRSPPGAAQAALGLGGAAGLVPGDERPGIAAQAERRLRSAGRRAVELEIAAAHARGLHLDHHLAGTWRRVREIANLDFSVAQEYRAFHVNLT